MGADWGGLLAGAVQAAGKFGVDMAQDDMRQQRQLGLMQKSQDFQKEMALLQDELYGKRDNQRRAWQLEDQAHNDTRQDARYAVEDDRWNKGYQLQVDQFGEQVRSNKAREGMEGARLAMARAGQARADAEANDPLNRQLKAAAQMQQANLMGYAVELDPKTKSVSAVKLSQHEQDAVNAALRNPSEQTISYLKSEPRAWQVFSTQYKAMQAQQAEAAAKRRPDDVAKAGLLSQVGNNYGEYFKMVQGLE